MTIVTLIGGKYGQKINLMHEFSACLCLLFSSLSLAPLLAKAKTMDIFYFILKYDNLQHIFVK